MKKIRLALLSGGISSEREVSLSSGNQVFTALDKEKYDIRRYDPAHDLARLMEDAPETDAALVILHGPFGEDGTIQGLLELLGIPYQGSGVLGSATAMNKIASKLLYEKAGLKVPGYEVLDRGKGYDPDRILERFGLPLVVKPVSAGSSVGVEIVRSAEGIDEAVNKAFAHDRQVLVEEFIKGLELTGAVLGNEDLLALPLIEIVPEPGYEFFDYEAKYTPGATKEICPARIAEGIAERARQCCITAHKALFCSGYSRTDLILSGDDIFVLETNTIPGMTATSLFPQAAAAAGIGFTELLDRLIELGMEAFRLSREKRGN